MLAVLAIIAFVTAYLEHWDKITVHSGAFDQTGLLYLGLALLAGHLLRKHGFGNWRNG